MDIPERMAKPNDGVRPVSLPAAVADWTIALFALIAALVVFFSVFLHLNSSIGERLTALPEVSAFFGSIDVTAQQTAFRAALGVLTAVWAAMFFHGAAIRRVTCSILDPSVSVFGSCLLAPHSCRRFVSAIEQVWRRLNEPRSLRLIDVALAILVLMSLAVALRAMSFGNSYTGSEVNLPMGGDPHSYVIYSRACDKLRGSLVSNGEIEIYGLGSSLVYCGLRAFGFDASYGTNLSLNRCANLLTVLGFCWALWHYWRSAHTGSALARMAALVALTAVINPLLDQRGNWVIYANLSGLRYWPVIVFLLFACCTNWRQRRVDQVLRSLAATTGLILSNDTGMLAIIGYAVMEGAQGNNRFDVIRRGGLTLFVLASIGVLAGQVLSRFSLSPGLLAARDFADSGFGGLMIGWNWKTLAILSMPVFLSTILIASAGGVLAEQPAESATALNKQDAVALAASIIMIAWIPYYLHRPVPELTHTYFIYFLLLLFPLSWIMQKADSLHLPGRAIGATVVLGLCWSLFSNYQVIPRFSLLLRAPKIPDTEGLDAWSGIILPHPIVANLKERIEALSRIRTSQSIVVTGIPFAVSAAATPGMRAPIEPFSTLGREQDLNAFLKRIDRERPPMLIFDGDESPAWGAEAIRKIISRIEEKIGETYRRADSSAYWRVWEVNDVRKEDRQ